jgi:hypothetical protein
LKFPILTFFLFLLIFSSCINDQPVTDAKPVAKVYNNYLYESELLGLVPFGASQEDSMAIISRYINNWIKKQLLLTQAEENLTKQQKDFSKQLEEYRNSLILYTYESELVRQNLDTVVNMWEMERYYNENTENFVLGEDIVKFLYIKIKDDAPALKQIVKLFKTNFVRNLDSLVYYAINFSEDYSLVTEDWVPFNRFLSKMPFNVDNSKYFLENNRFVEVKEDSFHHLIYFIDYKLKGAQAPFEYELANIKLIILNKRKKLLIREMHQKIYEQARNRNDFEYF